jgi:hypothetical protein
MVTRCSVNATTATSGMLTGPEFVKSARFGWGFLWATAASVMMLKETRAVSEASTEAATHRFRVGQGQAIGTGVSRLFESIEISDRRNPHRIPINLRVSHTFGEMPLGTTFKNNDNRPAKKRSFARSVSPTSPAVF